LPPYDLIGTPKMAISQADKAEQFRALHERPSGFVIPNPWDAGTARMLAGLGFEALATTSGGFAITLGRQDGAVTREMALAHASALVQASDLPVSADMENGYGDEPETVAETVRLAASVGLVGCSIEDATGDRDRSIYDKSHAVERVKAAVEAARSLPFSFTLTARAENFLRGHPDLDDTIERLQAFAAAGADVLYAPSLPDLTAIRTVCASVPRPVNVMVGPKNQCFPVGELVAAGVRRISLGPTFFRAAMTAFLRAAREVKEHGTFAFADDAVTFGELNALMIAKAR
jgi:2-methylisocitrate lyase-like PEP mutase family enzyme